MFKIQNERFLYSCFTHESVNFTTNVGDVDFQLKG